MSNADKKSQNPSRSMELQQRICNERNTKEKIGCPYLHVSAQFYQDENIELHQWYKNLCKVFALE